MMLIENQKVLVVSLAGAEIEKPIMQAIRKQNSDVSIAKSLENARALLMDERFDALFILMKKYNAVEIEAFFTAIALHRRTMLLIGLGPKLPVKPTPFSFYFPLDSLNGQITLDDFFPGLFAINQMVKNQSELSAMLIHDMRSPMQSVLSYMELLQTNVFGELNLGQKKMIHNSLRIIGQTLDLMNELSEVARFEQNSFHLIKRKFNLKQLIRDVVRTLWIRADQKNIKISIAVSDPDKEIYADYSALNRVLTNIISNAIRFSPKNSSIRLESHCQSGLSDQQNYVIKITDSGPGIPAEAAAMIFDKYYRIKTGRSGKGFGMGLYAARLFVEAHNGTIGVHNNREGGATFYLQIPSEAS